MKGTIVRRVVKWPIAAGTLAVMVMTAGATSRDADERAKQSLLSIQIAGAVVENYANEHFALPGPLQRFVPFRSLRETIDPVAPRFFPDKDAWGNQLLYWSDAVNFMIVSYGADGQPDYPYDPQRFPYENVPTGVNLDPNQDIILVNNTVIRGPLGRRGDPRHTMADLRSIATACEEYAIDNNFYPNSASTVVPALFLAPHLEPSYIHVLPRQDAWEKPILYWSNSFFYVVISTGADGTADAPYQQWSATEFQNYYGGPTLDLRRDIIFRQGQFVQWTYGIPQ